MVCDVQRCSSAEQKTSSSESSPVQGFVQRSPGKRQAQSVRLKI